MRTRRKLWMATLVVALLFDTAELAARAWGAWAMHTRRSALSRQADLTVLCVGDSWTYGVGVPADRAWPAQLQAVLGQRYGIAAHVVNEGQPGAHALTINQRMDVWLQHDQADIILYLAGQNPVPVQVYQTDADSPAAHALRGGLLRHLATYRLLQQVVARARLRADPLLHDTRWVTQPGIGVPSSSDFRAVEIRANLARAATVAHAQGARLIALSYPLPADIWSDPVALNQQIRRAAEELHVPMIDLEDSFRASEVPGVSVWLYGADAPRRRDPHLNERGYTMVADAIAHELASD